MVHPVYICSVSFTSYLHFYISPPPLPGSPPEYHMSIQSENVREQIMPRNSQQSSFPGCRPQPGCLPSSWASACFSILFYMSFASYFFFTQHTIHLVFVFVFFIKLQSPLFYLAPQGMPVQCISNLAGQFSGLAGCKLPLLLNRSLGRCLSRSFSVTNTSLRKM